MGYFRDDQPRVILDGEQQKGSTRCGSRWISSARTARIYAIQRDGRQGGAKAAAEDGDAPESSVKEDVTTRYQGGG
jgi:hypothetical protein